MYSRYIFLQKEVIMSYTMDAVQMNTRIDRTLKREGDAALAAAGYTPSQAVRALWEIAVKLRKSPEKLRTLLSGPASNSVTQELQNNLVKETTSTEDEGLRAHRERIASIQKRFADLGIDTSVPFADEKSDEEALEAALFERYWEEHK